MLSFDPFESYYAEQLENLNFLNSKTNTQDPELYQLILEIRNLWVSRKERLQKFEENEQLEKIVAQEQRYELVMYNTFTVSRTHFTNEETNSDEEEITYWEPKAIASNYKWKHTMGSRKTNIKENSEEIPKRKVGRPKKEKNQNNIPPKTKGKGRPKNARNKSIIKKTLEEEMSQINISPKKLQKMLKKNFKLKVFKNKEYKIKKTDWKKRCKVICDMIVKRSKLSETTKRLFRLGFSEILN